MKETSIKHGHRQEGIVGQKIREISVKAEKRPEAYGNVHDSKSRTPPTNPTLSTPSPQKRKKKNPGGKKKEKKRG